MNELFNIPVINYEGPESKNPLAFKYYDKDRVIGGKTMAEHLRFSMCYWHTLCADGTDMFGIGTIDKSFGGADVLDVYKQKVYAGFEMMHKLGIEYFEPRFIDGKNIADLDDNEVISLKEKINAVAVKIYGADGVNFTPAASKTLDKLEGMGFGNLPVCMAKTQYSLSDDQTMLGRPEGFTVTIRDVYVSADAGFVVVLTGSIMTMPGLPKVPAANGIDYDEKNNKITGLF